jgi:pilus assembly protein TadC
MSLKEVFIEFGKAFVPKKIRPKLGGYLAKAGFNEIPYLFFGVLFICYMILTYIIYFSGIYPAIKSYGLGIVFLVTFISWAAIMLIIAMITIISIGFYLNIIIYKRTKLLEDMLPDYLSLVSTNLKGGMNFEKSLWSAIKPEFGILANEIGIVSKKVATGNEVTDALQEFSNKYDSPILRRSTDLLKGELTSGGKVAEVIDSIVENLKKTKALKQEMAASTLTYMIFMATIVLVITPGLFALSKQLLMIIINMGSKIGGNIQSAGSMSAGMLSFSTTGVSPVHFQMFSVGAISIISVFTSMIISTIEKGDIKGGIKYIPLFLVCSVVLYFIFSIILEGLMGSFMVF